MNLLAVIPARGGSKGIPRKNLISLGGKPLIYWTIKAALDSEKIQHVVVSTDSLEIAGAALSMGAEVLMRPEEISQDHTPTLPAIQHVHASYQDKGFNADAILTLQPTSPLRNERHIQEAIELFSNDNEADSLVSVLRVPHHMTSTSLMLKSDRWFVPVEANASLRRQEKPIQWCRNGAAIYITRASKISDYIWGGKTLGYTMDKLSSIDIDDLEDLELAEAVFIARQKSLL